MILLYFPKIFLWLQDLSIDILMESVYRNVIAWKIRRLLSYACLIQINSFQRSIVHRKIEITVLASLTRPMFIRVQRIKPKIVGI